MIAGVERFRPAVPDHRYFAAQHHDAHVEPAVRMEIFGEVGLLTTMNNLEALAAQITFERLARERPAIAATARQVGDALGTDLLGMGCSAQNWGRSALSGRAPASSATPEEEKGAAKPLGRCSGLAASGSGGSAHTLGHSL